MTETDATNRPLQMPPHFLPNLEKARVYLMMKDMVRNVIVTLPRDHLKQMKIFANRHLHTIEASRLMILIEPGLDIGVLHKFPNPNIERGRFQRWVQSVGDTIKEFDEIFIYNNQRVSRRHFEALFHYPKNRLSKLAIPTLFIEDVKAVVKRIMKDFGCYVITRRCVMDKYEKHDYFVPGCVDPAMMSEVTKGFTLREPVPQAGWLMFDHPCTLREARCLQQDGVLPTVTLLIMKTPPVAPKAESNHTKPRNFFQQDYEGLKYAYKATAKEVHVNPDDDQDSIATKCFNAVRAFNAGHQGVKQGFNAIGAPAVYRVLLLGPRGSGRSSQAKVLAKHFGLVFLHFDAIFNEATAKLDDIGEQIRKYGTSISLRGEVVRRRLLQKDCIDHGWVMTGYPTNGNDFELLDSMPTPPNRIIFLNMDLETCRERTASQGFDLCTGKTVPMGSGPRVVQHPDHDEVRRDYEWDLFFTEQLAELRASAGLSAVEVDAKAPFDEVHVKLLAAVIAAPHFDIECCSQLRNVRGD